MRKIAKLIFAICRYSPEIVLLYYSSAGNFGGFSLKLEGKCQKFDTVEVKISIFYHSNGDSKSMLHQAPSAVMWLA